MSPTASRLLDVAEMQMRRAGYNAVSFRDLAKATAIKSASVHYHFPRKEDLAVALIGRYETNFFHQLDVAVQSVSTPVDRLQAFCDVYRQALHQDNAICLCVMLGVESPGLPTAVNEAVGKFFTRNIEWLTQTLDLPDQQFSVSVVAGLQGGMLLSKTLENPELLESVIRGLVESYR